MYHADYRQDVGNTITSTFSVGAWDNLTLPNVSNYLSYYISNEDGNEEKIGDFIDSNINQGVNANSISTTANGVSIPETMKNLSSSVLDQIDWVMAEVTDSTEGIKASSDLITQMYEPTITDPDKDNVDYTIELKSNFTKSPLDGVYTVPVEDNQFSDPDAIGQYNETSKTIAKILGNKYGQVLIDKWITYIEANPTQATAEGFDNFIKSDAKKSLRVQYMLN